VILDYQNVSSSIIKRIEYSTKTYDGILSRYDEFMEYDRAIKSIFTFKSNKDEFDVIKLGYEVTDDGVFLIIGRTTNNCRDKSVFDDILRCSSMQIIARGSISHTYNIDKDGFITDIYYFYLSLSSVSLQYVAKKINDIEYKGLLIQNYVNLSSLKKIFCTTQNLGIPGNRFSENLKKFFTTDFRE
jgi:hypothetical protein